MEEAILHGTQLLSGKDQLHTPKCSLSLPGPVSSEFSWNNFKLHSELPAANHSLFLPVHSMLLVGLLGEGKLQRMSL